MQEDSLTILLTGIFIFMLTFSGLIAYCLMKLLLLIGLLLSLLMLTPFCWHCGMVVLDYQKHAVKYADH